VIDLKSTFEFSDIAIDTASEVGSHVGSHVGSEGLVQIQATWLVPADLPYLEGHFPSQPIVPAVAIIDASSDLIASCIEKTTANGSKLTLKGIKATKFLNPLLPGLTVGIQCRRIGFADSAQEWSVDWTVKSTEGALAEQTPSVHLIARLILVF
jgi:3-hydroxymyristoyl/3-hydroxydecanoyl-(acyl carrier protein) dehydratase